MAEEEQEIKKKWKIIIAKDKKQLVLAIIVVVIFVLNGVYAGFRIYWQDYPVLSKSNVGQSTNFKTMMLHHSS